MNKYIIITSSRKGTNTAMLWTRRILRDKNNRVVIVGKDLYIAHERRIPTFENFESEVVFKEFDDYLNEKDTEDIRRNTIEFMESLSRNRSFRKATTYQSISLWNTVMGYCFYPFFKVIKLIKATENMIKIENPKKIIVLNNYDSFLFWYDITKETHGKIISWIASSRMETHGKIISWVANLRKIPSENIELNIFSRLRHSLAKNLLPFLFRIFSNYHENLRKRICLNSKIDRRVSEPYGKKIVVIIRGPSAAYAMIPVVQELRKNSKNEVLVISEDTLLNNDTLGVLRKEGVLPCRIYESYITENVRKRMTEASRFLKGKWRELENDENFRRCLSFQSVPLWEAMKDKFSFLFSILFTDAVKHIETVMRIVHVEKPDIIVLVDDFGIVERAASLVAKLNAIPTLVIAYGMEVGKTVPPIQLSVDKMAVWGKAVKSYLPERRRASPKSFVITGNPSFEYRSRVLKDFRREEIYHQLGLDIHKDLIVFTSQPVQLFMTQDKRYTLLYTLYNAMKKIPDKQFVVKLHPLESAGLHELLIRRMKIENAIIVKNVDLFKLLSVCKLLTTSFSTSALEAMMLDKPVIVINLSGDPDIMPYAERGAALGVYKEEDIIPTIRRALYDPETKKELARNRSKFVYEYAYKIDGKASRRVADLIMKMIEGSKGQNKRI